jgi:hypothetical protein
MRGISTSGVLALLFLFYLGSIYSQTETFYVELLKSTIGYKEISNDCTEIGSQFIETGTYIPSDYKECNFIGIKTSYYQIGYKGNLFYINANYIKISERIKTLIQLSGDNDEYKTIAINHSKNTIDTKISNSTEAKVVLLEDVKKSLDSSLDSWAKEISKDFVKKCKPYGISIISALVKSEYFNGKGMNILIQNPTTKTIKYVYITLVGYNPVNDAEDVSPGKKSITLTLVGPLAPNEFGNYIFNYVWKTNLVKYAKIINVKVKYMDNSIKVVPNPNLVYNEKISDLLQSIDDIKETLK